MNKPIFFSGWALALALIVSAFGPAGLWALPLACFVQNVSFTFVSRGRNSGSLAYHLVASIFSNGVYAVMLFLAVDLIARAKTSPEWFILPYALACMSGSVFAHWLALRVERGKGRNVQEDRLGELEEMLRFMDERQTKDRRDLTLMIESKQDTFRAKCDKIHERIRARQREESRPRTNSELIREAWDRCPTCDSPSPEKHPAVQHEGEVQICRDDYHWDGCPICGNRDVLRGYQCNRCKKYVRPADDPRT